MTWLAALIRPLIAAAFLGATLGGLGSMGTFFWANREMSPCASAGLDGVEEAVAAPMTQNVRRGVWLWSGAGAAISVSIASIFVIPPLVRLRRVELDECDQ